MLSCPLIPTVSATTQADDSSSGDFADADPRREGGAGDAANESMCFKSNKLQNLKTIFLSLIEYFDVSSYIYFCNVSIFLIHAYLS